MPWRYSPPDPDSLLHPSNGVAANDVRRQMGLSPVARVEALEREVESLKRQLCMALDLFRGFTIENGTAGFVTPNPQTGVVDLRSAGGTIDIGPVPYDAAHVVNLDVDVSELCWPACTSTGLSGFGTEVTTWEGFAQFCLDNGNGTSTCIAVPYRLCTQVGACA